MKVSLVQIMFYICFNKRYNEYTKTDYRMKLSKKAIKKIKRETRQKLAIALGFSEYWVGRLVVKNKKNGPLTTPSALAVLREETKLSDEDILESEEATASK